MAGKWKRVTSSPVILELAHCYGSDENKLIISEPHYAERDSKPQPSKVVVVDSDPNISVYGMIRAIQDKESKDVEIVVVAGPVDPSDLSYQFNYYLYHNPDDSKSSAKPPGYILFESLLFRNFFISWDLKTATAKCELAPNNMVVDDICTIINDDEMIQKFVWVIPSDDRVVEEFALKTYGESHFLAFERNGNAVLVQGVKTNKDVTIFKFRNQ